MSGQSTAKLFHFCNGSSVPGTKALDCKRDKNNALALAGFPRFVQLPLVGNGEGMPRGGSSLANLRVLQWIYDSDVVGHVLAKVL